MSKNCQRKLSKNGIASVAQCNCGGITVSIGSTSIKLSLAAFYQLVDAANVATTQLYPKATISSEGKVLSLSSQSLSQ